MSSYYQTPIRSDELYHFGIKGMHWGVRRYQNPDGSLKSAGKARYNTDKVTAKQAKIAAKYDKKIAKSEAGDSKLFAQRSAYAERRNAKLDRKVTKGKMSQAKADYKKRDFEVGTDAHKAGRKDYNNIIKNYRDMKIAAAADKSIKNSSEYKKARRAYSAQKISDALYGKDYTKLNYASKHAREFVKEDRAGKKQYEQYKEERKAKLKEFKEKNSELKPVYYNPGLRGKVVSQAYKERSASQAIKSKLASKIGAKRISEKAKNNSDYYSSVSKTFSKPMKVAPSRTKYQKFAGAVARSRFAKNAIRNSKMSPSSKARAYMEREALIYANKQFKKQRKEQKRAYKEYKKSL